MSLIEKLLYHLPEVGCMRCVLADPPCSIGTDPLCTCEDLFLRPLPTLNWRPTNKTWYAHQRRGENWEKEVTKKVSDLLGLSRTYTNSSFRPTTITQLSSAGFANRVTAQITGQKGHNVVEAYKRQAEQMKKHEWREASMLQAPSGRQALRGKANQWGEIDTSEAGSSTVADNFRRAVQDRNFPTTMVTQVSFKTEPCTSNCIFNCTSNCIFNCTSNCTDKLYLQLYL